MQHSKKLSDDELLIAIASVLIGAGHGDVADFIISHINRGGEREG